MDVIFLSSVGICFHGLLAFTSSSQFYTFSHFKEYHGMTFFDDLFQKANSDVDDFLDFTKNALPEDAHGVLSKKDYSVMVRLFHVAASSLQNAFLYFPRSGYYGDKDSFKLAKVLHRKRLGDLCMCERAVANSLLLEENSLYNLHCLLCVPDTNLKAFLHDHDVLQGNFFIDWIKFSQFYKLENSSHLRILHENAKEGSSIDDMMRYVSQLRPKNFVKVDGKDLRTCLSKQDYVYICYLTLQRRLSFCKDEQAEGESRQNNSPS